MAITLKYSNIIINPNNGYIPVRTGVNTFGNSILTQIGDASPVLVTEVLSNNTGLKIESIAPTITDVSIGDFDGVGNGTFLKVNDGAGKIEFNGNVTSSPGVVTPTALFLNLTINGIDYVIPLNT